VIEKLTTPLSHARQVLVHQAGDTRVVHVIGQRVHQTEVIDLDALVEGVNLGRQKNLGFGLSRLLRNARTTRQS
jgi:hypothetical protein